MTSSSIVNWGVQNNQTKKNHCFGPRTHFHTGSCLFTFLVNQLGKLGIKFKVYCTHWLYCLALYTEQVATSEQTILDCKKLLVLYLFQIIHGEAKCEQRLTKCESFVTCKQYDNMIYVCLIIIIIIKHIYKYKKFHKT